MILYTLSVIAFLIFTVYSFIIVAKFGLIPSISDSYYKYEALHKGLGRVFTAFLWAEAFMLAPVLITLAPNGFQVVGLLCCGGVAFCGCAAMFKDELMEKRVHFSGAISAVVFGSIWCFLVKEWLFYGITAVVLSIAFYLMANKTNTIKSCSTWWLEQIGFNTVLLTILAHCQHLL